MRIAFISQEYPPGTGHGGIASQTHTKAHGLAARGHEVHVISHGSDQRAHHDKEGKIDVIRIPGADGRLPIHTDSARWLTWSGEVAAAVAELHARRPLDVVDFPEWGAEAYVHLLNQTDWYRIPAVIHLHGPLVMFAHAIGWPDVNSEFYRVGTHMEETCLRLADAVFSSSRCSADWCARYYGIDADKIPVIHTGVDTDLFKPPSKRRRNAGPVVVFVGKLVRNKGVDVLVEAACRVAPEFPGLRLRLLGRDEGQLSRHLLAIANEHGLEGLLELPGAVRREKLPEELANADVFAAPSVYEGGPGFVYLEAMACGLPVIGCEGSGASEAIVPGTGLLVPPGDVDSLADTLRRLLADAELREQIGHRGREHVLAEADSRTCIARLEAFYESVVANAQRRDK